MLPHCPRVPSSSEVVSLPKFWFFTNMKFMSRGESGLLPISFTPRLRWSPKPLVIRSPGQKFMRLRVNGTRVLPISSAQFSPRSVPTASCLMPMALWGSLPALPLKVWKLPEPKRASPSKYQSSASWFM